MIKNHILVILVFCFFINGHVVNAQEKMLNQEEISFINKTIYEFEKFINQDNEPTNTEINDLFARVEGPENQCIKIFSITLKTPIEELNRDDLSYLFKFLRLSGGPFFSEREKSHKIKIFIYANNLNYSSSDDDWIWVDVLFLINDRNIIPGRLYVGFRPSSGSYADHGRIALLEINGHQIYDIIQASLDSLKKN